MLDNAFLNRAHQPLIGGDEFVDPTAHIATDRGLTRRFHDELFPVRLRPLVDVRLPKGDVGQERDHTEARKRRVDGCVDVLTGDDPSVPCGAVRLLPDA